MTTVATSSKFVVQRCSCFDCKRTHECVEAEQVASDDYKKLLQHCCKKHRLGHPQDTEARLVALRSLGTLALRAIIQRRKKKETAVTREERMKELDAMNRLDLRRKALAVGFPPADSVKADSDVLKAFIIKEEFPQAAEAEEPAKTTRKRTQSAVKKDAEPAANDAPVGDVAAGFATIGNVLDSHGVELDKHEALLIGISKMLHSFMCLVAEPEIADIALKESGLADLLPPQA